MREVVELGKKKGMIQRIWDGRANMYAKKKGGRSAVIQGWAEERSAKPKRKSFRLRFLASRIRSEFGRIGGPRQKEHPIDKPAAKFLKFDRKG